ncbi:hypothetical protein GUI12_03380 [Anaplasmataceae bacterium AB001_6]|nr:hypothetical protein GUI12_03380 [Anaplasmataceae bacterium AB001_6]
MHNKEKKIHSHNPNPFLITPIRKEIASWVLPSKIEERLDHGIIMKYCEYTGKNPDDLSIDIKNSARRNSSVTVNSSGGAKPKTILSTNTNVEDIKNSARRNSSVTVNSSGGAKPKTILSTNTNVEDIKNSARRNSSVTVNSSGGAKPKTILSTIEEDTDNEKIEIFFISKSRRTCDGKERNVFLGMGIAEDNRLTLDFEKFKFDHKLIIQKTGISKNSKEKSSCLSRNVDRITKSIRSTLTGTSCLASCSNIEQNQEPGV